MADVGAGARVFHLPFELSTRGNAPSRSGTEPHLNSTIMIVDFCLIAACYLLSSSGAVILAKVRFAAVTRLVEGLRAVRAEGGSCRDSTSLRNS